MSNRQRGVPTPEDMIPELIDRISRVPYLGTPVRGLNRAQWAALRFFASSKAEDRTSTAFARFHGTTKGTASQTIMALERKELIARSPMPGDARSHRIDLTELGMQTLAEDPVGKLQDSVRMLTPMQQHDLMKHLDLLAKQIVSDSAPAAE
ncbi:MAG: hypothetical protein Alpg2KO_33280 [Alphaproteobacteria bacterium]